jgi:Glycosyltransferase family 87
MMRQKMRECERNDRGLGVSSAVLNDLLSPYAQSAAWVQGLDPYSTQSLFTTWPIGGPVRPNESEFRDGSVLVEHGVPTAYPLSCFALTAPFTLLPWLVIKLLWVFSTVILFFLSIYVLIELLELHGWRRDAFIGTALLLAPFHTGVAVCNLAVTATEIGILSLWKSFTIRKFWTALPVSLSLALKPQIGFCFLMYFLLRRRWRVSLLASGLLIAFQGSAMLRLHVAHVQWIQSYVSDGQALLIDGNLGDFTPRNPTRFGLINLQVGLYPLLQNRWLTNTSVFLLCAIFGVSMLIVCLGRRVEDELLLLSGISVLSLLPIYHRFYDATLLIIPAAWLISHIGKKLNSTALGLFAVSAFFLPGGSLLETVRHRCMFLTRMEGHSWWNALIMAHSTWLLLLLFLVLLRRMAAPFPSSQREASSIVSFA